MSLEVFHEITDEILEASILVSENCGSHLYLTDAEKKGINFTEGDVIVDKHNPENTIVNGYTFEIRDADFNADPIKTLKIDAAWKKLGFKSGEFIPLSRFSKTYLCHVEKNNGSSRVNKKISDNK